jgi:hypothetical protein
VCLGWLKGASASGERHQATRDVRVGFVWILKSMVEVALAVMYSPPLDVGKDATLGCGGGRAATWMDWGCAGADRGVGGGVR